MKIGKRAAMALVMAAMAMSAIACGDDDEAPLTSSSSSGASGTSGGGTSSGSSGTSGGSSGENVSFEFVAFVKNQIVNETKNTTPPVTLDDKTFVESERSDLFDPAFFAGSYEQ